ncbi:Transposon Tf2-2 polyprotein [Fagus crenata]
MGYDFVIEYKRGSENLVADALSRREDTGELKAISQPVPNWIEPIKEEVQTILELQRLGMKTRVKEFIRQCDICQRHKVDNLSPAGLLQPLPIPTQVWSDISMDFIDGLPTSQGKTTIFVVVDRLSKYAHFIPISHPYTAASVAQVFFEQIFRLHGMPQSIVCDRDVTFTSVFWKELFRLQGTNFNFSGLWEKTTNVVVICSWDPKTEAVDKELLTRDEILKELRQNIQQAQFAVGDWVYLRLQPYRQSSIAFRKNLKLSPRYFGPFHVVERVGAVAYKLKLPAESKLHSVFHVSNLKRKLGSQEEASTMLPVIGNLDGLVPLPQEILDRCTRRSKEEVLVHWQRLSPVDATWEDAQSLRLRFPEISLEDKGAL